jgi:hypothetical protein
MSNVCALPVTMQPHNVEDCIAILRSWDKKKKLLSLIILVETQEEDEEISDLSVLDVNLENNEGLTAGSMLWLLERLKFSLVSGGIV